MTYRHTAPSSASVPNEFRLVRVKLSKVAVVMAAGEVKTMQHR